MLKKLSYLLLSGFLIFAGNRLSAQSELSFDKYHSPKEVQQILQKLQNNKNIKLHNIAKSPAGKQVTVLEIGTNLKDAPAIFVGANFEGNIPLATEGALYFAQMLLDSAKYTQNIKWYILAQPNPDASGDYFAEVKSATASNAFEINNDADDALNEDDFEDLNGDGYITKMRVADPEGKYIPAKKNPLIMEIADVKKGERGKYKIYTEGIDNDVDGKYNEDGKGGINVGIAFPHLFPKNKKEAGLFAGQAPEVYGTLRFIYNHPEIAMVYTLGSSDFCIAPPKGGRKGEANLEKIKIPSRYGKMFGIDVSKTYTMTEVIEMFKERVPEGVEVTSSMVAGFLGLGAAVNPQEEDLVFYKKNAEDYKEFLKAKKFSTETLPATPAKDGSFELWAYYHLGIPSFSMNLFTVPKIKEEKSKEDESISLNKVGKMTSEEFMALGADKINTFLKANNAPENFKAEGVIKMMEAGRVTPEKMVGMMKKMPKKKKDGELSEKDKALLAYSDKEYGGKGFVKWEKFQHPTLGEVEIGGYTPYLENTPKAELIDSLAKTKLPWLLKLSEKLPQFNIESEKITKLSNGLYRLEIYVANNGKLAYPISMGMRNQHPAPVVLTLNGEIDFLEGKKRTPVGLLKANQVKKFSWIIKADKSEEISAKIESAVFTDIIKQINIGG